MPFNIGAGELILLAAVALLLFGPRRLPEIGKAVGEGLASFKKAVNTMSDPVQTLSLPSSKPVTAPMVSVAAVPDADPAPVGSVARTTPPPAAPGADEPVA